jgi:hypothetical protein
MKTLLRKNTSNLVPGNKARNETGQNKLALIARAGYFSQFCEVG